MTSPIRRALAVVAAGAAALSLAACASPSGADPDPAPSEAGWPRTVEVGDAEVEIAAEPQRIVALSTETGDLALELVGPDRVAAVASGSVTEGAGNQVELAEQVEHVIDAQTAPDPEQILALDPDLVLLTERHDGEASAAALLEETGVPTLAFPSDDFQSLDAIEDSIGALGDALGAEERAANIVADMQERRDAVTGGGDADRPRVLLLMARGGQQMAQPSSTLLAHLVEEAGGEVVGASSGAQPADPERIVDVDPDVILVEDFRGAGLAPFASLLERPALADVAAVASDEVHLVSGRIASDTAGSAAVAGLEEVAQILR